ncbi:aminoglycoside 6-adenylyltransferase [Planococcus sp. APC 3906]|uniref:nucleotidyltransferase domain-containing protein n=1 Tax=Planococcus sp. APC 3906 TaxID=3035194 RepID=UPI0025B3AEC9|nr:nucleotidyltransferase domain-containing protein [Planococcus sp. APC 3906]MDN3451295.1 aminoglycoside 6-adenylyltransferase [Planococcus sp. APC 3906]
MAAEFFSRHQERDALLPAKRQQLLEKCMEDLTADKNVLAVYLSGSLAKKTHDQYSDIDLHIIVKAGRKAEFILNKKTRSERWGEVLFHEGINPVAPYIVSHYSCFVKIDSWYHAPDEIKPSHWLQKAQILYDPDDILKEILAASAHKIYQVSIEEVEMWKGKVLAFAHETYRAAMRNESYYAAANLDRLLRYIVSGWFMEMEQHFDGAFSSWSKVEGGRSDLNERELALLSQWQSGRNTEDIMAVLEQTVPEILRLNGVLSQKVGIEENRELMDRILRMAY